MRQPTQVPVDELGEKVYNNELQGVALARYVRALVASSLITLNANTRFVKVYAVAQDVYLKWAENDTDWCTGANFDEVIISGSQRVFAVPVHTDGVSFTRIMLVGRVAGSTVVVIEK